MKKGLGRGLDALFSIYQDDENLEKEQTKQEVTHQSDDVVSELDIKLVDPNRDQPRKIFEPNSLKELAESIKQHGVIQPIIVNQVSNNRYVIIAGERRFRASLIAGKTTIPAVIRHYNEKQIREVALVENLQREDLNPIEAAKAIKQLMDEYDFTQETVADRIGKSRPVVANTLRLLTLNPEVVSMIEKNQISAGHGKMLVTLDPSKQIEIAKTVFEKKLAVRDLEKLIKDSQKQTVLTEKQKARPSIELKELCHRMQRLFKTKVNLKGDDNKGKFVIEYFSRDDLDRLNSFISKLER